MPAERRYWLARLALFAWILMLGAWPWDAVRIGFARSLSAIGNPLLEQLPVVQDVQLQLKPLREIDRRTAEQSIQQDALLLLHTQQRSRSAEVGISLRRDAYLPLLIFAAAIAAFPLGWRRKLFCLICGGGLVTLVALASIWSLAVYLLSSSGHTGVIPDWEAQLVRVVFECWLTPPGNRVIAPLLLAASLGLLTRRDLLPPALRALPWEPVPKVSGSV